MKSWFRASVSALVALMICGSGFAKDNPCMGRWALTIPGGGAGWLGVEQSGDALKASVLWGGGSVMPMKSAEINDKGELVVTREFSRKDGEKKVVWYEYLTATVAGDEMKLVQTSSNNENMHNEFTGKRIAPLPPAPDLSKVKYGRPIRLLKEDSLQGWKLTNENATSGWTIKDGVLENNPVQKDPKKHVNYGNLRTEREFEDFNLKTDLCVDKGQNSGIYLRGIYEIQVCDSYGKGLDPHNMGALYSRITPTSSEEKKPGEWQTIDITLVDRHLTVILNGVTIIDNQPVLGCTGGALTSDETLPGPLYLQGDHSSVKYRNLIVRPVKK